MKTQSERKTLLIVDDVDFFIQHQISHLGHKNYNIHTACSGSDGLKKARSLKPDLILMDLFMPDINGDRICRILKQNPETSSIPVVMVSSGATGKSRAVSVSANCDGLIFKPVRRDLLLSVVENLLETNHRVHNRIQVSIPGTAILDEHEHLVTIHTLSRDGAFVEIGPKLIRGDLMELSFPLPGHKNVANIRAAGVTWCGSLADGGPVGAEVNFLGIDQDTRERIGIIV